MLRVIKPKNQRVKRALEHRAPKLVENPKTALFIKGTRTSQIINDVLTELHLLKKPESIKLSRHNDIHPFEDGASVEFLGQRNDASLFAMGSHSKKRPHNLILGRLFDGHLLDMIELGVDRFVSLSNFKVSKNVLGSKPCFVFVGDDLDRTPQLAKLKNLLLDFFRGREVARINLAGVDHVIVCTAAGGRLYLRHYVVLFKKSASKLPRVELEEVGPALDLSVRRTKFAPDDLYKIATRTPRALKPTKVKNVSGSELQGKVGRVHMHRQDFSKLQTRKIKGLKRSFTAPHPDAAAPDHGDGDGDPAARPPWHVPAPGAESHPAVRLHVPSSTTWGAHNTSELRPKSYKKARPLS